MSEVLSNTKIIAKNTVILYVRMIVTMLIALYSSRIILDALGVDDFGLYNAVAGVVALLSFLRSSLTSATQRFISFEMGKVDGGDLVRVFSVSLTTHFLISIVVLLLAETIGLWFLNTKISIPDGRELAANLVYQLSVFSIVISFITVPYSADVISHERMTFYAIVSIIEACLKLLFAFVILRSSHDRLILYGGLVLVVNIVDLLLYWLYCRGCFMETRYKFVFDKQIFLRMFSFSGWTLLGQFSVVGANQGTSILINMFHPLAVNASMGIAQQVNGAITGLTSNFQTAFQPQITKSYAAKDLNYLNLLINYSSKISFFLLFIFSLPIMLNIDIVLAFWLKEVPVYTNVFCILFIVSSIANAISTPLWIAVFATGRIKYYQIVVSVVYLLDIIIVYILFKLGMSPVSSMIVKACINSVVVFVRMFFAKRELPCFSFFQYFNVVITPCFLSSFVTLALTVPLSLLVVSHFIKILIVIAVVIISLVSAYFIGLNKYEQDQLKKALSVLTIKLSNRN